MEFPKWNSQNNGGNPSPHRGCCAGTTHPTCPERFQGRDSPGKHPGLGLEEMNSSPLRCLFLPGQAVAQNTCDKCHRGHQGRSELLIAGKTPRPARGGAFGWGATEFPKSWLMLIPVIHQHLPASHGRCPASALEPGENPESPASPQSGFWICFDPSSWVQRIFGSTFLALLGFILFFFSF